MTEPPRTLGGYSMTIDELMQRTPAQVAAYFIPDIIHVTAGCTSRKFRREQPPIQKQLDEILHKLLERTTHQSKLLAAVRNELFDLRCRAGCGPDQEGPDVWQLLAEAREALEPFAKYADKWTKVPDDLTITHGSTLAKRPQLTMGDCYKARAVHAKLTAASGALT